MRKKEVAKTRSSNLRSSAEKILKKREAARTAPRVEEDPRKLLHELQVHQIELEMQNEELKRAREQIETALERYMDLYDFAPVGYLTLDAQGRIREINLTGARLLQAERLHLEKKPFSVFIAHEYIQVFRFFLSKVFEAEGKESCEVTLADKSISIHMEAEASPGLQECRAAMLDISGRIKAEKALEKNERLLALASSGASIGLFEWDIATSRHLWTEQHARLLGLRPTTTTTTTTTFSEEYTYRDWADRVHPEDLPRVEAEFRRCMAEHVPYETEYRVIWPDGSLHWLVGRGVFRYAENGQPLRMVGMLMDITDRKSAELSLKQANRLSEAQNVINSIIHSTHDIDKIMQTVIVEAVNALNIDASSIGLLEGDHYVIRYSYNMPDKLLGLKIPFSELKGAHYAVSVKDVVAFDDASNDDRLNPEIIREYRVSSMMIAPLHSRETVLGTINLYCFSPRRFSAMQIDFARKLTAAVTLALDNARLYTESKQAYVKSEIRVKEQTRELRDLASHLQSVREEERTEIARDLHDELGQSLIGLKMELVWFRDTYGDHRPIAEKSLAMLNSIDKTIASTKRICSKLRPSLLDHLGLMPAIEWQTREFEEKTGIKCSVIEEPRDMELGREQSTALYRIAQEALTNVAKHAEATEVTIRLVQDTDFLRLEISDNGKGIKDEELSKSKSFGLLGMRERVYAFNGEIKITGSAGEGTKIEVSIPFSKN